jgi:hypothetical protein
MTASTVENRNSMSSSHMTNSERPLRVFLCHASNDKPIVRNLFERLVNDGVDTWLDTERLLPGHDWQLEIERAVRKADIVIVCLSESSITKEGFVQKEIRIALDAADEKPDGTIFIIPARLEPCAVPERMSRFQWVDLFSEGGYEHLLKALAIRTLNVGASMNAASDSATREKLVKMKQKRDQTKPLDIGKDNVSIDQFYKKTD